MAGGNKRFSFGLCGFAIDVYNGNSRSRLSERVGSCPTNSRGSTCDQCNLVFK